MGFLSSSSIPDVLFGVLVVGFALNMLGVFSRRKQAAGNAEPPPPSPATSPPSPSQPQSQSPSSSPPQESLPAAGTAGKRKPREQVQVSTHHHHPSANALPPGTVPTAVEKIEERGAGAGAAGSKKDE